MKEFAYAMIPLNSGVEVHNLQLAALAEELSRDQGRVVDRGGSASTEGRLVGEWRGEVVVAIFLIADVQEDSREALRSDFEIPVGRPQASTK